MLKKTTRPQDYKTTSFFLLGAFSRRNAKERRDNFHLLLLHHSITLRLHSWDADLQQLIFSFHISSQKSSVRDDREITFLFFPAKKRNRKKLAAADKSAKILSSSLDKNKLASLRQYFCLNHTTTKFLNAISPRRQGLRELKIENWKWKVNFQF